RVSLPSLMDRPSSDLHLVLCLLALLCIHGKGQGKASHLTINCTMKYCREPPHVIWCKLQDTDTCAPVNDTGNIGTRQTDFYDKNKLISFLNFKPVSIHDEGLYRCETKGSVYLLSHTINVTFSDVSPDSPNVSDDEVSSLPWLPYIIISISVVLLVFIVIVATLLIITDLYNIHKIKPIHRWVNEFLNLIRRTKFFSLTS
uniref:Ig-like domain-containing protein n=1 Tax=Myripristis murdjan TaxID=586833 RepID=A0A667X457_9TELE